MKAYRNDPPPPKFEPITIVLETEEEAEYFWTRMYVALYREDCHPFAEFRNVPRVRDFKSMLRMKFFASIDRLYRPDRVEKLS